MDAMHASDGLDLPTRHRFTLDDVIAMVRAGVIPEESRMELIDGELIDMMPIGPGHDGLVSGLTHALVRACGGNGIVRVQSTLRLGPQDAPQPDFLVVRPRADFYTTRHPGPADTLLVVEVAESSLRYDRTVKLPLYARAGVPEYWIVDLKNRVLSAYRSPSADGYAPPTTHKPGERLALHAAPGIVVPLDLVFA